MRAAVKLAEEHEAQGRKVVDLRDRPSRRLRHDVPRPHPEGAFTGFTDAPKYADAREVAETLMAAYLDGKVDQVEVLFNQLRVGADAGGHPDHPAAAAGATRSLRALETPSETPRATATRSSSTSRTRRTSWSA